MCQSLGKPSKKRKKYTVLLNAYTYSHGMMSIFMEGGIFSLGRGGVERKTKGFERLIEI